MNGQILPTQEPTAVIESVDSSSIYAVEGLIKRQVEKRDELKKEIKNLNESLKSIVENDVEHSNLESMAKTHTNSLKKRKTELLQSAESMKLKFQIKERREQIKDLNESLSHHLANYEDQTGQLLLEDGTGKPLFEITKTYKIRRSNG